MTTLQKIGKDFRRRIPLAGWIAPSSAERTRAASLARNAATLDNLINRDWYTKTFGLESSQRPVDHYREVGSPRCYAPSPELAASDQKTLKPWGAELLLRLGIRIGAKPGGVLQQDDPSAIGTVTTPDIQNRRIAIVTAVLWGVDRLLPVFPEWLAEADFYAFVDHEYPDAIGWKRIPCDVNAGDARRRARHLKTHLPSYFSMYDSVLWIDSNIFPCASPVELLEALGTGGLDFATFQHPQRNSLVMEAAACVQLGKEDASTVFTHLRRLHDATASRSLALFETNVMYLNPKATAVKEMCSDWWREILAGSKRDQLSLPIAIDAHKELNWGFLKEQSARTSGLFVLIPHEKTSADADRNG